VYAICADADEQPVFACTLFVPMVTNSSCYSVPHSCGWVRIACVCVYGIRADADEFGCTLFVRMPVYSTRFLVRYSCGCGRIACVCQYGIRADADE